MDKIVILGAGSFGGSIAEALAEENMVTVVDRDAEKLNRLRSRIDARFIAGLAESPTTLEKAGCEDADAILAVTADDVVNLAVCRICFTLYGHSEKATRIARIRNQELSENKELLESFGVSEAYNTEDLISEAVAGVIEFNGARKVHKYWHGLMNILLVKVLNDDPCVGLDTSAWYAAHPDLHFRVIAIHRDSSIVRIAPGVTIQGNDELFLASRGRDAIEVINAHRPGAQDTPRKIFVGGGGTIGEAIASKLEKDYHVTLIEPDPIRCATLVQNLSSTLVDTGDPTDSSMLKSEDIEHAYYFCAVTERDEENIISALLAKQLGCTRTAVLINRNAYQKVLLDHDMDTVISPSEITVGILLKAISDRKRERIQAIGELGAHVLELTVQTNAELAGMMLNKVEWPANIIPCVLGNAPDPESNNGPLTVHFPDSDHMIAAGDHIIVYVTDKNNNTLNKLLDIPFYQ